jgi:hypothetical protein
MRRVVLGRRAGVSHLPLLKICDVRHPPLRITYHLYEKICECCAAQLCVFTAVKVAVVDRLLVVRIAKAGTASSHTLLLYSAGNSF